MPTNNPYNPNEKLSDKLRKLRERPMRPPPNGYFEELENAVYARIENDRGHRIVRLIKRSWVKAAVVLMVLASCLWLYLDQETQSNQVEWVFTEDELQEFLEDNVEELDKALIYATARNEEDLYLETVEPALDIQNIDYLIDNDDDLEKFLLDNE